MGTLYVVFPEDHLILVTVLVLVPAFARILNAFGISLVVRMPWLSIERLEFTCLSLLALDETMVNSWRAKAILIYIT